ncbi:efflux transporter outer membrane subunit [Bordetella avium]|uniref:Multidrug efflux system outer membrane protein n=1 Tax=Bordetella avium (strain 197N) TaxID=360910 RepID=Q2KXM2_BORA1|nr:efflux transporter outer membrane subunit [Bordetella avium]AZY53176.1 multidrug transporter [Bordetella avium]RIQ12480.1 efflux transporter outer membrane subunit [Bordetella avium]RIQ17570.1 efflux transporter outer membrane subunit [Bordetella avium]RIQ32227.1 efflux transporter outer membrane subunit [Bordetella avium]RIQ37283.1 efflux transporter outer membrane subunit [Bordetella avium]
MTALMLKRGALMALLAAGLAGCSLAPDYHRPQAPVSANWPDQPKIHYGAYSRPSELGSQPAAAVAPQSGVAAADIGWRNVFLDPRLQALIGLALNNSRDLRVAVLRVEEARAQYGIQRGAQWPSIGVGAQGTRQHLPRNMRAGGPDSSSISSQYQAGIGLTTFEIDLFGRLRSLSEAAYQQYLSTEQAQRAVQITLVGAVAQAYFNLRAAEVQLDLVRKTLQSRQESYNLVKTRFDGGVASELDLNQAKSLLDSASADLAQLARSQAQATNALTVLLGVATLPADLPAPAPFGRDQMLATVPAGLPSDLLERRPDILAAEHQLLSANANIGAARAAFFPTISLTGLLGAASPSLGNLFKGGQGYWSFSPQLSMPLFSGGSIVEGLNLAKARDNIAVAQYEQTIQQAFREVSDALAGEATYSAQLEAQRGLEASSARTLELSNLRYVNGVDSYLQVQTSQVDFFNAQIALVQTGLASLINRVELYKALGGGWVENTALTQAQPNTSQAK